MTRRFGYTVAVIETLMGIGMVFIAAALGSWALAGVACPILFQGGMVAGVIAERHGFPWEVGE